MRSRREEMTIRKRLEFFRERVDSLKNTKLLKKGLKSSLKIKVKDGKGVSEIFWPDDDDLRSYLITFRHFILENSPVFLNRIYNLCIEHVNNNEIMERLERNRVHWHSIHQQGAMKLIYQGEIRTPEFIVDLFINGEYFHLDEAKRESLKGLPDLTKQMFKFQFNDYLYLAKNHLFFMDSVIEEILEENLLFDDSVIA